MNSFLKDIRTLLLIVSLPLIAGCMPGPQIDSSGYRIVQGYLDLGNSTIAPNDIINLAGDWRVRFADDSEYQSLQLDDSEWPVRNVIGHWFMQGVDYDGIVWYRLRIVLPTSMVAEQDNLAIQLPFIDAASEIYWNGKLIGKTGQIGSAGELVKAGSVYKLYQIPAAQVKPSNLLAIRARSADGIGGISKPGLFFGNASNLRQYFERTLILDALFSCIALVLAFYHLTLFYYRRQDRFNLYYALITISAAFFLAGWNSIGARIFENWYGNLFLIHFAIASNGLWAFLFFQNLLGVRLFKIGRVYGFITIILLLWVVLALVIQGPIFYWYMQIGMPAGFLFNFIGGIAVLYIAFQGIRRGAPDSKLVSVGLTLFFGMLIAEIIGYMLAADFPNLTQPAYLILVVVMALAVARRNAFAQSTAEDLSKNLETKVADRTREIETLYEFARQINASSELQSITENLTRHFVHEMGMRGSFLVLIDESGHYLRFRGGYREDLTAEQDHFLRTFRPALEPESGTLYLCYHKARTIYLRGFGEVESEVDQQMVDMFGLRSFVHVPLIIEGQVHGILSVDPHLRTLKRQDLRQIENYADQIAGAVKNSYLLEEIEQEKKIAERLQKETEALNHLLKRISQMEDIERIMQAVGEFTAEMYNVQYYSLYSVDHEALQLNYMSINFPDWIDVADREHIRSTPIPLDHRGGAFTMAYKRKQKHTYFKNAKSDGVSDIERFVLQKYNLQNMVVYPLRDHNQTIAFLNFLNYDAKGLSKHQIEQLSILSDQIAGIIRSNKLLDGIRIERANSEKARSEIQALAELSRQIMQGSDLDTIIDSVYAFVLDRFQIETLGLFLPRQDYLYARLYRTNEKNYDSDVFDLFEKLHIPTSTEGGTLSMCYRRGRLFHPSRIDPRWVEKSKYDKKIYDALEFQSFAHVPLFAGGETIGVLSLNSKAEITLDSNDMRLLQAMGDQIAGAVQGVLQLEEVEQARSESDKLLANILPPKIATELKEHGSVEPLFYDNVTVLFTDFKGFTAASANMLPDELVEQLDSCFTQFDELCKRNNMEKLKTIGDAYMCAGGLPIMNRSHAIDACLTALEMREFMKQITEIRNQMDMETWGIRIGLHSGPVTAGVIGNYKFTYDIWGDTVNTASRMESAGEAGRINISQETYELVMDFFECEHRGQISAKGKGQLDMYFLERIKANLCVDADGLIPNASFQMQVVSLDDQTDLQISNNNSSQVSVHNRDGW